MSQLFFNFKGKKMNKQLIALMAAVASTSVFASATITGKYEGVITDGATYTQDLDLTLKASVAPGTSVTMTMENLTGGSAVSATTAFIETDLAEGLQFKGGTFKSQNGSGLLQKAQSATNKMSLSTNVGGMGVRVTQGSGDANTTADVATNVAGVMFGVQNVANADRFITVSSNVAGVDLNAERQKTTTAVSAGLSAAGMGVTAVLVDVNDATAVTQDDGILGDISDANNGTDVKGVVVTKGQLTGKYIVKNDLNTYVARVKQDVLDLGYSKTENADGVMDAKINVAF